ncbi:MAG TPA: J domain-containing protein, partial [Trichocoleus sp.]
LKQFTDPYAVLGVSLAADERRILKRYRQVAKLLHPDVHAGQNNDLAEFSSQVLSRLVNPAYQRLKVDKGRNETLATLRFKVRRLSREDTLKATFEPSQNLLQVPEPEVDIFYEQALLTLSADQYETPEAFDAVTRQIGELNLIYLRRKMGDPVIREKRTGLVAASQVNSPSVPTAAPDVPSINYAERHSRRAQEYLKNRNFAAAIQELKDAVKIDPKNSSYHCLLGQAYLLNKLPGMAKVHLKQALKLNPHNEVALKYARQLQIDGDINEQSAPGKPSQNSRSQANQGNQGKEKRKGLFGGLFSRH